jgi:hypothetical protein
MASSNAERERVLRDFLDWRGNKAVVDPWTGRAWTAHADRPVPEDLLCLNCRDRVPDRDAIGWPFVCALCEDGIIDWLTGDDR